MIIEIWTTIRDSGGNYRDSWSVVLVRGGLGWKTLHTFNNRDDANRCLSWYLELPKEWWND